MTAQQKTLFPEQSRKQPAARAKAVSKVEPSRPAAQLANPLSPADTLLRAKNIAAVNAYRARLRIGDIRMSGVTCKRCGEEKVEELIGIEPEGGQTWMTTCLECAS